MIRNRVLTVASMLENGGRGKMRRQGTVKDRYHTCSYSTRRRLGVCLEERVGERFRNVKIGRIVEVLVLVDSEVRVTEIRRTNDTATQPVLLDMFHGTGQICESQ